MPSALEKLRELRTAEESTKEKSTAGGSEHGFDYPARGTEYTEYTPAVNPAVHAVLKLLALSPAPIPHPSILKALMEDGASKEAAKAAIGFCQARGWIEHNLTTGYVLCEARTAKQS